MKELSKLDLPGNLRYASSHEWVKAEADLLVAGISDYAQDQLGDVVYVELPKVGNRVAQGDEFGTVESVKAVSELCMPVGGEIVMINETLEENPALVNEAPYAEGWMIKIRPDNMADMDSLMDKDAYLSELKGE